MHAPRMRPPPLCRPPQVAIGPINVRDIGQDSINAAAGGFVMLSFVNFVILIVVGKDFGLPPGAGGAGSYQPPGHLGMGIQFQTSAPV